MSENIVMYMAASVAVVVVGPWLVLWLMHFRGRRGLPDAAVGQVWRCEHNGDLMRVAGVRVMVNGSRVVDVEDWNDESTIGIRRPHWGIRHTYAYGMWNWRQRLRDERRVLVEVQP